MAMIDGKGGTVTLEELVITCLAQTDALAKLLVEKKLFTEDEFMQKLREETSAYEAIFRKKNH